LLSFGDAEFWERAWQQSQEDSPYARRKAGRTGGKYWDKRAAGFLKLGRTMEVKERLEKVIHMLEYHGKMNGESRVLDIGCGTGNYAIPLAKRTAKVIALDPSWEMIRLLQERAEKENICNIETGCVYWENVKLAEKGWDNAFDVVIAMMTPGINDKDTLQKMMAACRGTCFLAGHLQREDTGRRELWKRLTGGEIPPVSPDVFHMFHLLYAWGYYPSLEIEHRVVTRDIEEQEIIEVYKTHLHPYLDLTPEVEKEIEDYVRERSTGGIYKEERQFTVGYLLWDVE